MCVCWMSCGADLWTGAGAEGSAGVQDRFIIHALPNESAAEPLSLSFFSS